MGKIVKGNFKWNKSKSGLIFKKSSKGKFDLELLEKKIDFKKSDEEIYDGKDLTPYIHDEFR